MTEDLNKRHQAAIDAALLDLDVAAIPTESDVFVRCGTGARDLHDAITDLRQRLQASEERAERGERLVRLSSDLLNRWLLASNGFFDGSKLRMTAHPVHDDTVEFLAALAATPREA